MKTEKHITLSHKYIFPFYTTTDYFNFVADQWIDNRKISVNTHNQEKTLLQQILAQQPQVVILGIDRPLLATGIIARLSSIENRPTIVSLLKSRNESLITECYEQGADRVIAAPYCSAKIFRAMLGTLVRKEQYYPPYRISSAIQTINIGDTEVRLTKKTFDVAQYLFINHGKLIPKPRILQDIWGLDSKQCLTHRLEVHISHVRRLLTLDGSHGWEIRARRRRGYGIFHDADAH